MMTTIKNTSSAPALEEAKMEAERFFIFSTRLTSA